MIHGNATNKLMSHRGAIVSGIRVAFSSVAMLVCKLLSQNINVYGRLRNMLRVKRCLLDVSSWEAILI